MEKEKKMKKKNNGEEAVIFGKSEKRLIKFGALLVAFFATGLAILIFVFTVISIISIANSSTQALLNNNVVFTLLSKMNGYETLEVANLIGGMTNRVSFIILEVVAPMLAFVGSMLLLLVLSKRVIDFISDVSTEKDLFTEKKLAEGQDMISILSLVLFAMLVLFSEPSIIFYLLIELLLFIVYMLFKKCVRIMNK